MQIVIDIPEEDYKAIKNMSVVGDMTIPNVFDAVRNGIPLPKGTKRIVDADKLYYKKCILRVLINPMLLYLQRILIRKVL